MTEIKSKKRNYPDVRFAVAPMIDWSDRHCRYFHRLFSKQALLYTEMVVADAIIHGPRDRLLGFDTAEHPVALQLGGSDPVKLKKLRRSAPITAMMKSISMSVARRIVCSPVHSEPASCRPRMWWRVAFRP